jgi:hypothetical protein
MIELLDRKTVAKILNAGRLAVDKPPLGEAEVADDDVLRVSAMVAEVAYLLDSLRRRQTDLGEPSCPARILLVGESNPYGSLPSRALFPHPRNASGNRIRVILGLTDAAYMKTFDRVNLCREKWNLREAVQHAGLLLERRGTYVLLGSKVRSAFHSAMMSAGPGLCSAYHRELNAFWWGPRHQFICLPHPSGRCRAWNDPDQVERSRALMRAAAPHVAWGEARDAAGPAGRRGHRGR